MICWIDTNADFLSVSLFPKVIPAKWGPFFSSPPHIPNETHQLSGPQVPCLTIHIFTFTFTNGSLQETHLGFCFFQVLDQGARHESPFTVVFGGSFFSKHILLHTPPNDGVSRSHHFQKCEPWRLLTKFICGELTCWGMTQVLRRCGHQKHYSIIHFRRMIDVKITLHSHRFWCQMADGIYLNTYCISCRWHVCGISIYIHNYELDCVLQQYHAPIPSTIGAHDIARVQCYLKHGINGVLHHLAVY